MSQVKVGLIQMSPGPEKSANLEKALKKVREAKARGAQVVCLQELFGTGYFCQKINSKNFNLAESVPGPTTDACSRAARDTGTVLIAPLFEKRSAGLYSNSAAVFDADGAMLGVYRKTHIPDDPGFYEKYYFAPGDNADLQVFQTRFGVLGVLICWDQWFPEAARLLALRGAQIIFYPTAIGWLDSEKKSEARSQLEAWETVQRSHAIANGVYVASVNRVGREGRIRFWGSSFVADPSGRILSKASYQKEEILVAGCDLSRIEKTRRNWPFLRDRRIDLYRDLNMRTIEKRGKKAHK